MLLVLILFLYIVTLINSYTNIKKYNLKSRLKNNNELITILEKELCYCPFINIDNKSNIIVNKDISYTNDIIQTNGINEYQEVYNQWFKYCLSELEESKFSLNRISLLSSTSISSTLSQNIILVYWNVTFIPTSIQGLVNIGKLFNIKRKYFNVLDKENEISVFKFELLLKFIKIIIDTGEMRLPHAVIQGCSEYNITTNNNNNQNILISINEKLNLIRSIDINFLKNRKLITDLLEFLDSRKPISIGINNWNDLISKRLPLNSLPGMRQFDIDGLDNEKQSELLDVSQKFISFAFFITIGLGLVFGSIVLNKIFLYQVTDPSELIGTTIDF